MRKFRKGDWMPIAAGVGYSLEDVSRRAFEAGKAERMLHLPRKLDAATMAALQEEDDAEDLCARLDSLSKSLEGSGRIDEHEQPGAYATVLDAMNFVRAAAAAEHERYAPLMQAVEWLLDDGHMNQEHLARLRAAWEAV